MRSTRHDFRIIFFSFFFEKLIYFSWMLVKVLCWFLPNPSAERVVRNRAGGRG